MWACSWMPPAPSPRPVNTPRPSVRAALKAAWLCRALVTRLYDAAPVAVMVRSAPRSTAGMSGETTGGCAATVASKVAAFCAKKRPSTREPLTLKRASSGARLRSSCAPMMPPAPRPWIFSGFHTSTFSL